MSLDTNGSVNSNMVNESQEQRSTQDTIVDEHKSTEFTVTNDNNNKLSPEFTSPEKVVKSDDEKEFGSPSTCLEELEQELQLQRRLLENEIETHVVDKANGGEVITKSTKSLAAVENELLVQQVLVEEALGTLLSDSQQNLDTTSPTSNEMHEAYHNVANSEITDEKKEEASLHSRLDTMSFTSNEMHDEAGYDVAHSELREEKREEASSVPASFGELLLAGSWQETPLAKEIGDAICATSSMVSLENGCCVAGQETLDTVLDEEVLLSPPPANESLYQDDLESVSSTEIHDAATSFEKVGVQSENKPADNESPNQDYSENSSSSESHDADVTSPSIEYVGVQVESKMDSSNAEADKTSDAPVCAPATLLPNGCEPTNTVTHDMHDKDDETNIPSTRQSVPVLEDEASMETCTPSPHILESAFKENKAIYVKDNDHGWVPAVLLETTPKYAVVSIFLGSSWRKSTIGDDVTEKKEDVHEKPSKSKRVGLEKKDIKRIAEKYGVPSGTVRAVLWKDYKDGTLPLQNSEAGKGDLVDLFHLHEASILFYLKERHYQSMPYTRVGDIMVAMNPFMWINDLYAPHTQERYTTSLIWNGKQNIDSSFVRSISGLPQTDFFERFECRCAIKEYF